MFDGLFVECYCHELTLLQIEVTLILAVSMFGRSGDAGWIPAKKGAGLMRMERKNLPLEVDH